MVYKLPNSSETPTMIRNIYISSCGVAKIVSFIYFVLNRQLHVWNVPLMNRQSIICCVEYTEQIQWNNNYDLERSGSHKLEPCVAMHKTMSCLSYTVPSTFLTQFLQNWFSETCTKGLAGVGSCSRSGPIVTLFYVS